MFLNKSMDPASIITRTIFTAAARAKATLKDSSRIAAQVVTPPEQRGYEYHGWFYPTPGPTASVASQIEGMMGDFHYRMAQRHEEQCTVAEVIAKITPPTVPMSGYAPAVRTEMAALRPEHSGAMPIAGTAFLRAPDGRLIHTLNRF